MVVRITVLTWGQVQFPLLFVQFPPLLFLFFFFKVLFTEQELQTYRLACWEITLKASLAKETEPEVCYLRNSGTQFLLSATHTPGPERLFGECGS